MAKPKLAANPFVDEPEEDFSDLTIEQKLEKLKELDEDLKGWTKKLEQRNKLQQQIREFVTSLGGALAAGFVDKPQKGTRAPRLKSEGFDPDPAAVAKWKEFYKGRKVVEISTAQIRDNAKAWGVEDGVCLASLESIAKKEGVTSKWHILK